MIFDGIVELMTFHIPPLTSLCSISSAVITAVELMVRTQENSLMYDHRFNLRLDRSPGHMFVPHKRQQVRCHISGLVGDRSDGVIADLGAKGTGR